MGQLLVELVIMNIVIVKTMALSMFLFIIKSIPSFEFFFFLQEKLLYGEKSVNMLLDSLHLRLNLVS